MARKQIKIKKVDKYEKYADVDEMYASRTRKVELLIPSNFRMLCAILTVNPERVLRDFMGLVSSFPVEKATSKCNLP